MSPHRRAGDDSSQSSSGHGEYGLYPSRQTPPYQRSLALNTQPYRHDTHDEVELQPVSPAAYTPSRLSPGPEPNETWPLHYPDQRSPAASLYGDREHPISPDYMDGPWPPSRRHSGLTMPEASMSRPPYHASQSYNRSVADYNPESIPGTPSRLSLIGDMPPRSESPYAPSWMPPRGEGSVYGSRPGTPLRSYEGIKPLYPDAPQYFEKEWVKEGLIAKLHERDDYELMPTWKRYLFLLAPFLAIATLVSYWIYFALRITFVISAQHKQKRSFPLAWIFIAIEISVAIPIFLQSFWSIFILKKRRRPKLRLVGNNVPTVDVFVTCCGEDVDLILDTVRAACDVDYPPDRFRVVVLDDAKDAELQKACRAIAAERYQNLHYRARTKIPGVPHHFKAGNLNYGLEEVHMMPGGASEFVAALDADMIPEESWLRAVMPHLVNDSKMALACPPQLFYNVPPSDPLCQSLDFFVHVSEPIKDALGVAWCTGSGYVLRRMALEEIGQFPRGSLAEDVATSTLMLGRGWKTAYVHEPLQFGTVPDSYGSHLKQRTRWAIGTVDTSFKLKFCLYGDAVRHMTLFQRMSSFIYAVLSLFNIFLTLSLFAMPVVLITGNALVAYATDDQLRWLIRTCFIAFTLNRLCEFVLFLPAGYNCGQRGSRAQLWMSPYIALTIIRSFVLPTWLGGQTQAFKPSGSLKSELNERDANARAPLYRRVMVIVFNYLAGYHILYVYFCLIAVTLTSIHCIVDRYTTRDKLVCLLTHAFWPPLAWIMVVSAFWIPITYAIDPPSMPDRETLLNRDPKTGIAHPTPESKKTAFKPQTALFEIEYFVTTAFTAVVFVAAFFY